MSRAAHALTAHWLESLNGLVAIFVGLPFVAPILLAAGQTELAGAIYGAYRLVCHQWAFRSYFLLGPQSTYPLDELRERLGPSGPFGLLGSPELGYKVAFCERDVAIYLAVLAAGLLYAALRGRLEPLSLPLYLALIAPMAIDGFTQLLGWRESTVELRSLTGGLFGLGSVWLLYPRFDIALDPGRSRGFARRPAEGLELVPSGGGRQ